VNRRGKRIDDRVLGTNRVAMCATLLDGCTLAPGRRLDDDAHHFIAMSLTHSLSSRSSLERVFDEPAFRSLLAE
jgi:hypothetical protein